MTRRQFSLPLSALALALPALAVEAEPAPAVASEIVLAPAAVPFPVPSPATPQRPGALPAALPSDERIEALREALAFADRGQWAEAMGKARVAGPVSREVLEWRRLRAGEGLFEDYVAFLRAHPDWPGLAWLRRQGEDTILDGSDPAMVVAYFTGQPPQTGAGALALVRALDASGQRAAATAEAVRAWRGLSLTEAQQTRFLALHGTDLAEHHGGRMQAMLDEGNLADARRMLPLVTSGTRAVAEARIALQADQPGVDTLINAVPDYMAASPGLAYDRWRWRIRHDAYDGAADLLLERSASAESLGDPERWASWRGILARREMRLGNDDEAYRLASGHQLSSGSAYADLEWLSGYIALRRLNRPDVALAHFGRFQSAVSSPISLGRAGYWQGRAFEALGRNEEARQAYGFGARYQTAFYGLLAAEKLGLSLDPALVGAGPQVDWRDAAFTGTGLFRAGELLAAADDEQDADRFLLHMAESLPETGLEQLADYALDHQRPHLALLVAKEAAGRGHVLPRAYFPLNGLEKMDLPVAPELALSIARRESEFDPQVVSHAGAKGLMQVMPGTAKLMAAATGQGYDEGRLTSDWRYNAGLGSAYLAKLEAEFGPTPALVAAGYNAGPGRPRQWIKDFGDPRDPSVDVVDWVESIPYTETQNYVMRVAECLPIYRARLAGQSVPIRLTDELRGR